jgi:hypothetical protein
MYNEKPVSTPLAHHFKLSAKQCAESDDDLEYMSKVPYSSVVGSLMYAMVCSCPDLSHAMSVDSRYMANPGREYWKAAQWILIYLRGFLILVYALINLGMVCLAMLILR